MATYNNFMMGKDYLDDNPNSIFVFGDNLIREGYGGAAGLRDHPQAYGFVTKKFPDNKDTSFYKPEEYKRIFEKEITKLKNFIEHYPNTTFYISQLGGGLANKYQIWETVIKDGLESELTPYDNVVFMW